MEERWNWHTADDGLADFNQLVLEYQDAAYRHAQLVMQDRWLAEDVVQESFLKAFQNFSRFRGGSFRAWLMRIVTNTAYDMLRRASKRPTQPLLPEDEYGEGIETPKWLADPNASVEGMVEADERTNFIYRALSELQDIYRDVLVIVDLQHFDYVEAAQALGVPVGTVKSRLARARMQMREKLKACPSLMEEKQIWKNELATN